MNSYLHMNSHVRMGVLELKLQHGHMNSYSQICRHEFICPYRDLISYLKYEFICRHDFICPYRDLISYLNMNSYVR